MSPVQEVFLTLRSGTDFSFHSTSFISTYNLFIAPFRTYKIPNLPIFKSWMGGLGVSDYLPLCPQGPMPLVHACQMHATASLFMQVQTGSFLPDLIIISDSICVAGMWWCSPTPLLHTVSSTFLARRCVASWLSHTDFKWRKCCEQNVDHIAVM